ncbi:MAG: sigma 54-interacting transcriptional regulator [Bacteriovoracaceae bacterium]|nr:sigma 54-interacting transcriptional regulator [Bacteriovoracaceae bacterium]
MHQLKNSGLRYGDSCTLITPMKPKKKITLNRTCWDIVPESDGSAEDRPTITIPGAASRSFRWRLELEKIENEARFVLKSIDGTPFTLNGQTSREAFVESFDTLSLLSPGRLEFNRIDYQKDFETPFWPEDLKEEKVLQSSLPILLQGETGTGKSHLARKIHQASGRKGSFVALNISAISSGLIEGELFGHMKGSFTGAIANRKGALAQANGGTLFIDEVDSLPLELQVKLLLFLDHGFFRPIGGIQEERTNARLIFASGQLLEKLVSKGLMRKDFYFRLSQGVVTQLPSLRSNPKSIERHCQIFSIENEIVISNRLMDFYLTLPWPGNLRQLRGHLMAKKIRSKTRKLDFDKWDESLLVTSSELRGIALQLDKVKPIEEIKREYAKQAYQRFNFELHRTAKELGINSKTLKMWLS